MFKKKILMHILSFSMVPFNPIFRNSNSKSDYSESFSRIPKTTIQYRVESTSYSATLLQDERVVNSSSQTFYTIPSWMDWCERLHYKGRESERPRTKTAHEMFEEFEKEQERKKQQQEQLEEKYHKRMLYFQRRRALYINMATSTTATSTYTALIENKKDDDDEESSSG